MQLRVGRLPAGTTWRHVVGLSTTAGVGFTVALFVTGLAFDGPVVADAAKVGILVGSTVSGVVGYLVLRTSPAASPEAAEMAETTATTGAPAIAGADAPATDAAAATARS